MTNKKGTPAEVDRPGYFRGSEDFEGPFRNHETADMGHPSNLDHIAFGCRVNH